MRFEPKYTDNDVLNVLDKTKLMTAGFIAKRLGCTLQTAKTYLKSLTERNLIEVVEIDEGQIVAYKLK
jgi:predicted ArsR family transcriptional regulator